MKMTDKKSQHRVSLRKAFAKPTSVKRPNSMIRIIHGYMAKHFRKPAKDVIIDMDVNNTIWKGSKSTLPRRLDVDVVTNEGKVYVFMRGSKKADEVGKKAEKAPKAVKETTKEAEKEGEAKPAVDKKEKKMKASTQKVTKESRARTPEEH